MLLFYLIYYINIGSWYINWSSAYICKGTHWIYRVVDMLLRGSAEFGPRGLDSAFLDLQDHGNIEQLDSPRILGSHLPFELLPRQVKDKKTKIVYVFRHLKSVLTSGYCQVKGTQMMAGSSNQMTMDMYADFFFTPPSKSQAVYLLLSLSSSTLLSF